MPKSRCLTALLAVLFGDCGSVSECADGDAVSFALCIPATIRDAADVGGKRCPVGDSIPALSSI